jgi:glycosyltransferase involved in cell wall biosynthesis
MIDKLRGAYPNWFDLDKSIVQAIIPETSDRYVPDADATLCTWWQMAYAINELSPSKGNKCNLIQDYEVWTGQEDKVHRSYSLPLRHCVIARYLQDIVEKHSGKKPELTPLAIDVSIFKKLTNERDPASLIMLYSEEPRKGSAFGIEALKKVREKIPSLKVTMFSVYQRPDSIPDWIDFYTRPDNLPELYNKNSIFFSPSLGEGWALPPAESMACGCAVVCTDVGGHRDYGIDGVTCLLVPPKDTDAMAEAIHKLITNNELRLSLAETGHKLINTEFTWDASVARLESILLRKSS